MTLNQERVNERTSPLLYKEFAIQRLNFINHIVNLMSINIIAEPNGETVQARMIEISS